MEAPPATEPQDLFVFFDGTANDKRSATNVWRLFELVSKNGSASTKSLYVEGVGNARNPLTGMLLGFGMEKRLGMAYEFLATNYRPRDRIYLVGFSRGAHQARALAGILSYSGLPRGGKLPGRTNNKIREATKNTRDASHPWSNWDGGQPPMLANALKDATGLVMEPVEVEFLGIWDTVPGSLFKKDEFPVGACKETSPEGSNERYKSDSYPPIREIAHAVSADEKRSRFRPLFVCDAIRADRTKVHQTWFPGAHSDVGGGYRAAPELDAEPSLSNLSFNWMVRLLAGSYDFAVAPESTPESAIGLAHWSVGNRPGNFLSRCEDRTPLAGHQEDESLAGRRGTPTAPLLSKGKLERAKYPRLCPTD